MPSHLAHPEWGVASRHLSPVFRDCSDLPSPTDLGIHTRQALQDPASLIVICSRRAQAPRGGVGKSVSCSYDGTAITDKYTFGYDVKTRKTGNGSGDHQERLMIRRWAGMGAAHLHQLGAHSSTNWTPCCRCDPGQVASLAAVSRAEVRAQSKCWT
jgi:hypothetical protein